MADTAKTPPPPKKPHTKDGASRRNLWTIIGVAAVVAVIAAGVLIYVSQQSSTPSNGSGASATDVAAGKLKGVTEVTARFDGIPQNGNMLGDPAAPVTITEYADLRCPACQSFALDSMPQVITDLVKTGQAKYQFRIWPILGTDSVLAAQCGIAAQQQNKLFEYQDIWYINQQDEMTEYATPAFCNGIATSLGLDLAMFDKDRQNEALWSLEIQDVQVVAAQQGFGGTPSFVITGPKGEKVLGGSIPTAEAIAETVNSVS
jgi:protein-disulfide isomerase